MPALDDRTSDGKYVVFKNEDWRAWQPLQGDKVPEEVQGCVVLRFQDPFTAPALWSYVGAVHNLIEMAEGFGANKPEQIEAMHELADKFATFAQQAMEYRNKKLPD